jgi:hypothetical protein
MTTISYTFYIERENYFDKCELKFDINSAIDYEERLDGAKIQSGEDGLLRGLIDSAIGKIQALRGVKEEETQKIVDMVINSFEALPLVLQDLANTTTSSQVVGALMRAFKMFTHKNILTSAFDTGAWILDQLRTFTWTEFMKEHGVWDPNRRAYVNTTVQSGPDIFDNVASESFEWVVMGAREVLNGYKDIKKSAIVVKLQKLLQYFLSYGLFQNFGLTFGRFNFNDYEAKKLKQSHNSMEGFIFTILDTTVWMLERGMQAVKLGSFLPFFHSSQTYTRWADRAQRVTEDSLKMGSAQVLLCEQAKKHTPEEKLLCIQCQKFSSLDEHEFVKRLESVLADGDAIIKFATDEHEKELCKKLMRELRLVEARYMSKDRAQRDRKPPFSLLVFGESCVAKTMFMNICFMQYAKVHGKDESPECMWTRNPMDKFYSGFKASKWCIRIDDIAMFNPNATPLDPSIADVILLSNGVSLVAPMADLDEKGVIPVRPELLLASTNTEHLNAHCYFSYPLAVRRRFPYVVDLKIQEKYCAEGSSMLDPALVSVDAEEYQNIWHIKLKKFVIKKDGDSVRADFEVLGEWDDIYDFLKMYSDLTIAHKYNQERAEATIENMRRIPCCPHCYMPPHKCQCSAIIQAGPITPESAEGISPLGVDMSSLRGVPDLDAVLKNYLRSPQTDADYRIVIEEFRRFNLCMPHVPAHYVSMSDSDSEISIEELMYDTESDDDESIEWEDRRTWYNKSLDWVDDQVDIVKTIAKSLAAGISASVWKVSDRILAQASDLMVLYQIKKVKAVLAGAGTRIYETFFNPLIVGFCKFCLGFFIGWAGTSALMKMFGGKSEVPSEVQTDATPALFRKDEKPNPWAKDEMILSEFQVASTSVGWNNSKLSLDEVCNRIKPNVVHIAMEYKDETGVHHIPSTATCVSGHIYMTNNHCVPTTDEMTCVLSQEPSTGNIGKNIRFTVAQTDVFRLPDRDLAFFWCLLPPKMDTTGLFLKNSAPGVVCNGFYIHCHDHALAHKNGVQAIRSEVGMVPAPVGRSMRVHWGQPQQASIFGDCGSPLIGMTALGPVILGIHQQLKRDGRVGATEVLKSDIDLAIAYFGSQVQCGAPNLVDKLGSLHQKSVLRWPNEGQAHVYGSTAASSWRAAPKSRVCDTFISEAAQKEGFVKRCGKPVMAGPEVWAKNVEPTVTQKFQFNKGVLDKCVQGYVDDILKGLSAQDLSEMIKLDDKTTMNGYPGVKFLDKINRQTSMGYPYRKSKQQFILPCEEDGVYQDAVEYTQEVWEEINLIRDVYSRGERYMPVFVMSLKDEPVPYSKIAIKKTRGFMGGPAAWQFVYRQQLLSFVRIFQLHPHLFEGAPGMNTNSCQWRHLYEYITKFGVDRMIAGDYAKFDKRMSPLFILAAFDIIIAILKKAGRPDEDILAVKCMAHDVAYPLTDVQGDFVEFFGSNPSGHALTVIINCLVNSLYMRYCFYMLNPEHTVANFKDYVALITYGDDNAQGVSEKAPWYNHTSISKLLAEFDVVYTMADKESESVPYINIDDVSFLKRRFVVDGDRMCCPLEWASIDKMLTSCVASRSVCPEEQAIQSIRSAVGEFYQYGRETFEENVKKMKNIVKECKLEGFVTKSTFPSYAEFSEAFREAGKSCAACPCVAC